MSLDLSEQTRSIFSGAAVVHSRRPRSAGTISLIVQGAAIQFNGLYEPNSEEDEQTVVGLDQQHALASGRDAFRRPEYSAEQSATMIRTSHHHTPYRARPLRDCGKVCGEQTVL